MQVGGLAKRYMAPGWRIGWICMHDRCTQSNTAPPPSPTLLLHPIQHCSLGSDNSSVFTPLSLTPLSLVLLSLSVRRDSVLPSFHHWGLSRYLWIYRALDTLTVDTLTVYTLTVYTLTVYTLTVDTLTVYTLTVYTLTVYTLTLMHLQFVSPHICLQSWPRIHRCT